MFYKFNFLIVLEEKSLILLYFLLTAILGRLGQSSVRKAVLHVDAPSSLLLALQCTEVRFARFQWIYYYGNNKSTGKETCKTHYCALYCLHGLLCCYAISVSYFYVYQMSWKILSNNGIWFAVKSCHLAYVSNHIKRTIKIPYLNCTTCTMQGLYKIPNFAIQIGRGN